MDRPVFPTAIGKSLSRTGVLPNATLNVDISPNMGVGYVIGPRIAGVMFAGGVLSWLVLLPLFSIFGNYLVSLSSRPGERPAHRPDEPDPAVERLHPLHRRRRGAGGGPDARAPIPTIVSSFRDSVRDLSAKSSGTAGRTRTERDMPMTLVLGGTLLLALFLALAPRLPTQGNFMASVLVVIFGFFFITVSSRIVGLIGSSSIRFRG